MLLIILLFSFSFDLRSSSEEKVFPVKKKFSKFLKTLKVILCSKINDEKYTYYVTYLSVKWKLLSSI